MNTLFISYNGAMEPLVKSQGTPYIEGLGQKDIGCVMLTFEKSFPDTNTFKNALERMRAELNKKNIEWFHLKYHKKPTVPATLLDILTGTIVSIYIVLSRSIHIIHCRATVAGLMGFIAARLTGRKLLFDARGLMAEEYVDGGIWKKSSLLYHCTAMFEKHLLKKADAVVVLSENIRQFLLTSNYLYSNSQKKRQITVIPCCVDVKKFNRFSILDTSLREKNHLEGKFVFLYSGSLGTWYLLEEMCDFFAAAKTVIPNAYFLILTHSPAESVIRCWSEKKLDPADFAVKNCAFENMPEMLTLADAGIFFIKPSLSKRASCPIKFAEFLAAGIPVVINAGIGDTDTIVKTHKVGVVVEAFNTETYLEAAREIETMSKEKTVVKNKCFHIAQSFFSVDIGVSRYFDLYKNITQAPIR